MPWPEAIHMQNRSVDIVGAIITPPNIPLLDLQSERLYMGWSQITQPQRKYINVSSTKIN